MRIRAFLNGHPGHETPYSYEHHTARAARRRARAAQSRGRPPCAPARLARRSRTRAARGSDERRATRAKTHRRTRGGVADDPRQGRQDPETTTNGLSKKRREVIEDMTSFAAGELSGLLKDPDTNWQPQDWLPNPESPDFLDQVRAREGRGNAREGAVYPRGVRTRSARGTRDARRARKGGEGGGGGRDARRDERARGD